MIRGDRTTVYTEEFRSRRGRDEFSMRLEHLDAARLERVLSESRDVLSAHRGDVKTSRGKTHYSIA